MTTKTPIPIPPMDHFRFLNMLHLHSPEMYVSKTQDLLMGPMQLKSLSKKATPMLSLGLVVHEKRVFTNKCVVDIPTGLCAKITDIGGCADYATNDDDSGASSSTLQQRTISFIGIAFATLSIFFI